MTNEFGALIVAAAVLALPALYVLTAVITVRAIDVLAPDRPHARADAGSPPRELPEAA